MMKINRFFFYLGMVACIHFAASSSVAVAQEFSYNGDTGPAYWHELDDAWEACAGNGVAGGEPAQSPIDISKAHYDKSLEKLDLVTFPTTIDIFNNGHTIEQHYADTGTSVVFNGITYELSQIHFHTLSEHTVNGRHATMEMHAVFSEDGGTNLVIGQLFEAGKGNNPFLQALIEAGLPEKNGDTTETAGLIDVGNAFTNTGQYYTYAGSLTTPPCSEVVTWVVLKKEAGMSVTQYEAFRGILGNNFRPLQDRNDRVITKTRDH
jgi:carbonic anhydrase